MAMAASGGRTAGAALAVLLATVSPGQEKGGAGMELIELANGTIVVGVVPPLGGRVVELKTARGENLLDSDPKRWKPPYPAPAIDTPFQPWNGRIVWVGPQTGFWSQQDLEPELKKTKAQWPPDPFNETGRFEVVEKTPTLLRLKGKTSPVTGLAFEHEYEITGERTVRMKTTATNGRDAPVSWDLWANTRVRPEGFPYVLPDGMEMLRMDGPPPTDGEAGVYPSELRGGWLTFLPGKKLEGHKRLWAKAYVRPTAGVIAYFLGKQLLLIRAPIVPKNKVHGEQTFIEVYRGAGKGDATVLELEMHGPFQTLAPGASMSFEQTFEVLDYDGPSTPESHVARLEALRPAAP
jgi:hypothetical protein